MNVSYVGTLSLSSNSPAFDPFLFLLLFRYLLGIPLMISLSLLLTLQDFDGSASPPEKRIRDVNLRSTDQCKALIGYG